MCTVCGCGGGTTAQHNHEHEHEHEHEHGHRHHGVPGHGHVHDFGSGPAGAHVPGLSQGRMIQIEQDILAKNDEYARANRDYFAGRGILCLNLVSSPGSGKTSLLVRTLQDLGDEMDFAVIEGDQQTSNDADRIRATGAPAVQINTGRGCHLDGHMVGHALEDLDPAPGSVLLIENVGNLVCPAAFDLGEAAKVVILSVTEGEDKPLKYPDMFHAASVMILSKTDLLPYVDFDVERCLEYARRVNPGIRMLQATAKTPDGPAAWYDWLREMRSSVATRRAGAAAG
jgi:hydrogenase nickel incorporation protein HypB